MLLPLMLCCAVQLLAQRFVANAPSHVSVGENFRLTYTINTQNVKDFHVGNIPDELELITGPYVSSQSSYQMVNGHTSSTSSNTYTYILCATKAGTFTIPSAHIVANGKKLVSNVIKVKVSGQSQNHGGAPRMHDDDDDRPHMRDAGTAIKGSDLFIKVSASKTRVHEQEPILLTYKVYTLVDLIQLEGKMPDLTGFHTQQIQLPQQKSFHIERVNGRPYRCVTWEQYVMYPQMTGKLEIPSISFVGTVVQQNRNVDPFEAFFNGGSGYIEVKREIKAPGVSIQVDPLPTRPANFSGGVGKFDISAQLNKKEVKANEPITLRVVISGVGNLKLIKEPAVVFPKDFDKYDAKVTDKTKITPNGVEGSMVYDIMTVPRHQGTYEIPPVEFTYYDTSTNSYKTLKSEGFKINVVKGSSAAVTTYSEDVEQLNKDIRYIKTGDAEVRPLDDFFFGSAAYWISLAVLAVIFVSLFVVFRQRAIDNSNIGKMRGKKANKVATRRLRAAKKLMAENRQAEFYDETLRALWGYVGDKLGMAVEQLDKDNINGKLTACGVNEDTVAQFIGALDECEYNRYAPGDASGNMHATFDAAMTAIVKIEESLKMKAKKTSKVTTVLLLVMLLTGMPAAAVTKKNADDEYKKGNYQQAIKDYEELLRKGPGADLYYNLGNAYYRTDNITRAVLNYERALLLSPGDEDIRFNLQMARSKTIDKITPRSEMFFVTWYKSAANLMSVDAWANTALFSIALSLLLVLVYLFAHQLSLRKTGFYGAALFFVLFILSNVFAYEQKTVLTKRTGAIIIDSSVALKKTPVANSDQTAIVHEGSRVEIIDDTMTDWKFVRLADGREGWIRVTQFERI